WIITDATDWRELSPTIHPHLSKSAISSAICGFFRTNLACFDLGSLFRPSDEISRQPIIVERLSVSPPPRENCVGSFG
ncbi:MAG TPA: hypothetical protein VKS99_07010, partial [Blastocatellia bacterium]|nr:hypothetical protein [Blastocatellia bacterium]